MARIEEGVVPTAIARVTPVDHEAWYALHLDTVRHHGRAIGIVDETLYRDHQEPRTVVLVQTIVSIEQFQDAFATDELQQIIANAPIEGPPTFWFLDTVERIDVAAVWA
jgi:hypothetical protein